MKTEKKCGILEPKHECISEPTFHENHVSRWLILCIFCVKIIRIKDKVFKNELEGKLEQISKMYSENMRTN